MTEVSLEVIRLDGGTQLRHKLSDDTVAEYAENYRNGVPMPPVDLFYDGVEYWLGNGFHRFHGAKRADLHAISALIHDGTKRDAILFACSANDSHGLRRTIADKRKIVLTLIGDDEWGRWSDRQIASKAAVSNTMVGDVRRDLAAQATGGTEKQDAMKLIHANVRTKIYKWKLAATVETIEALAELTAGQQKEIVNLVTDKIHDTLKQALAAWMEEAEAGEGEEEDPSDEEKSEAHNEAIDKFCRRLTKYFKEHVPRNFWTEHKDRLNSAEGGLKVGVCNVIRAAKTVSCPACDGGINRNGRKCGHCGRQGYLPKHIADAIPETEYL